MSIARPPHSPLSVRHNTLLARTLSALAAAALASCGGGGGGGSSTDSGTTAPSTTVSVGAGFPLAVSVQSPTALSGGTLAYVSGTNSVTAVAEGSQSLNSSLVTVAGLFGTATLSHANCYGPTVAYANHDDSTTSGTLSVGDVAMWTDDDTHTTGSPACSVAELDTQLGPIATQTQQSLLLTAAMRRTAATTGSGALPDPGASRDLTTQMAAQLAGLLGGVTVQSATISALSDASQYSYRLVLQRGSGSSAETLEVVLLHTPNDTSERFAGVLQLTHSRLTASSTYGCTDTVDGGTSLYKVAHVTSLGYNRYDDALSTRLRSAQFCGGAANGSTSHFADVSTVTESGEMDTTVFLDASGLRRAVKGWKRELVRYSADVNLSAFTGDYLHAWQNTPQETNSRVFLVHGGLSGNTRSALVFHAFGGDLSLSDGTLSGMYCNWAGPGASHASVTAAFQSQSLSLGAGSWSRLSSAIHYAPTNSCGASGSMSYDANGDGTRGSTEGAGTSSGLDLPTGGRTDVQSEAIERGYWAPTLF